MALKTVFTSSYLPLDWVLAVNPDRLLATVGIILGTWLALWYGFGKPMRQEKWKTLWHFTAYVSLFIYGQYVAYVEGVHHYLGHAVDSWEGQMLSNPATVIYFEAEIAYYSAALVMTLLDSEQKDFWAMFIHHTLTPVMIFVSIQSEYSNVGLIVMILHDASDVFLHGAKLYKLMFGQNMGLNICFFLFISSFFVTRLVVFPWIPAAILFYQRRSDAAAMFLGWSCATLVVLHTFWFYLIVKMVKRTIAKGSVPDDIRTPASNKGAAQKGKGSGSKKAD